MLQGSCIPGELYRGLRSRAFSPINEKPRHEKGREFLRRPYTFKVTSPKASAQEVTSLEVRRFFYLEKSLPVTRGNRRGV